MASHGIVRYRDRKVRDINKGDLFSLDDGKTYQRCASPVLLGSGVVLCESDSGVHRINADADSPCVVRVETVRVRIAFTLEIDVTVWSTEYGVERTASAVAADARTYYKPEDMIPSWHFSNQLVVNRP